MARLVLALIVIAIVAGCVWTVFYAIKAALRWQRQRELARFAPDLLHHHGVPRPVEAMILEQREQLAAAEEIMRRTLRDEDYDPNTSADAMEEWLLRYRVDQKIYDKELHS